MSEAHVKELLNSIVHEPLKCTVDDGLGNAVKVSLKCTVNNGLEMQEHRALAARHDDARSKRKRAT